MKACDCSVCRYEPEEDREPMGSCHHIRCEGLPTIAEMLKSSEEKKLDQVRAMLPDLEERAATKGVARKLRSILG